MNDLESGFGSETKRYSLFGRLHRTQRGVRSSNSTPVPSPISSLPTLPTLSTRSKLKIFERCIFINCCSILALIGLITYVFLPLARLPNPVFATKTQSGEGPFSTHHLPSLRSCWREQGFSDLFYDLDGEEGYEEGVSHYQLVFSINSGRSGSHALQTLLHDLSNNILPFPTSSLREPALLVGSCEPKGQVMSGDFLRITNEQPLNLTTGERAQKVEFIREWLSRELPCGGTYIETNHMFIKTFFDVVLDFFLPPSTSKKPFTFDLLTEEQFSSPSSLLLPNEKKKRRRKGIVDRVDVIVLRRFLPEVLKSFVDLGLLAPNKTGNGWSSMHSIHESPDSVITPLGPEKALDIFDLSIGYLLDIEARVQKFVTKYQNRSPALRVWSVRAEDLARKDVGIDLLRKLGIPSREVRRWSKLKKEGGFREAKADEVTTLQECEDRINRYLALCSLKGISVPALPQMKKATKEGVRQLL